MKSIILGLFLVFTGAMLTAFPGIYDMFSSPKAAFKHTIPMDSNSHTDNVVNEDLSQELLDEPNHSLIKDYSNNLKGNLGTTIGLLISILGSVIMFFGKRIVSIRRDARAVIAVIMSLPVLFNSSFFLLLIFSIPLFLTIPIKRQVFSPRSYEEHFEILNKLTSDTEIKIKEYQRLKANLLDIKEETSLAKQLLKGDKETLNASIKYETIQLRNTKIIAGAYGAGIGVIFTIVIDFISYLIKN
ncbi:MAG: hypothetical protein OCC45_02505 [Desulfotalea sp.]